LDEAAIALAREGEGEPPGKNPIGCVIVRDGQVIGEACNEVDLRHDATAHAEILAMGRAGARLKCNELTDAVLYTTLQPCGMCTMASIWAKIGRIVYGAGRDDVHEMYFEDQHLEISYELFNTSNAPNILLCGEFQNCERFQPIRPAFPEDDLPHDRDDRASAGICFPPATHARGAVLGPRRLARQSTASCSATCEPMPSHPSSPAYGCQ
jgi:tRNA(Arg) A34 adenosine deaminase TadA